MTSHQNNSKVVKLHVHRNTKTKHDRRKVHQDLKDVMKTIPKDIDGYALMVFHRDEDHPDGFYIRTEWRTRDTKDVAAIPDLTHTAFMRDIMGD